MFDPFNALATFVLGKMKQSAMALWLKLLFTLWFSMTATFLFVCGFSLAIAKLSWPVAVGSGMLSSAVAMVLLFRRSPLTKGLMVVVPSLEAAEEFKEEFQTIERQ